MNKEDSDFSSLSFLIVVCLSARFSLKARRIIPTEPCGSRLYSFAMFLASRSSVRKRDIFSCKARVIASDSPKSRSYWLKRISTVFLEEGFIFCVLIGGNGLILFFVNSRSTSSGIRICEKIFRVFWKFISLRCRIGPVSEMALFAIEPPVDVFFYSGLELGNFLFFY
jgi:hypothetical protein